MASRIAGSIFCLLFIIAFGAGGAVGIAGIGAHAGGWLQTRAWQPVMASVQGAQLSESRGRKSTTYRVSAAYTYSVEGKEHRGTRVGYTDTGDNIGSWQEDRYAELDDARRGGRRILAWVDPQQPGNAIIDRELRWGLVLFMLPFATVFPAVSLGELWILIQTWRNPARTRA